MFMSCKLPEGGVILAQVVRHVPVGVDREQLGAGVNQELDQVQVATGGSRVLKKKIRNNHENSYVQYSRADYNGVSKGCIRVLKIF